MADESKLAELTNQTSSKKMSLLNMATLPLWGPVKLWLKIDEKFDEKPHSLAVNGLFLGVDLATTTALVAYYGTLSYEVVKAGEYIFK